MIDDGNAVPDVAEAAEEADVPKWRAKMEQAKAASLELAESENRNDLGPVNSYEIRVKVTSTLETARAIARQLRFRFGERNVHLRLLNTEDPAMTDERR